MSQTAQPLNVEDCRSLDGVSAQAIRSACDQALTDAVAKATRPHSCQCPEDDEGYGPDAWFDRSICPEPCGSMHNICVECGRVQGYCPISMEADRSALNRANLARALLDEHTAVDHDGDRSMCSRCLVVRGDLARSTWPCPEAAMACTTLDLPKPFVTVDWVLDQSAGASEASR